MGTTSNLDPSAAGQPPNYVAIPPRPAGAAYGDPNYPTSVTDANRPLITWDAEYNPQLQALAQNRYQDSQAEIQRLAAADPSNAWRYGVFGPGGPAPAAGYYAGGTGATGSLVDQEKAQGRPAGSLQPNLVPGTPGSPGAPAPPEPNTDVKPPVNSGAQYGVAAAADTLLTGVRLTPVFQADGPAYGSPDAAQVTDASRTSVLWDAQDKPQI